MKNLERVQLKVSTIFRIFHFSFFFAFPESIKSIIFDQIFGMKDPIYNSFIEAKKKKEKRIAVLIDPDKMRLDNMTRVIENAIRAQVDYFFVGGSLILDDRMDFCLDALKAQTSIPTILFPSSPQQINKKADGILFLSLISGRNPDLLIGQHVLAAPILKNTSLEIISTGYMLIDGGVATAASYISNTIPIPGHKDEIAYCTAIAGEMLGLKTIYMDAGSGARQPISETMIQVVSQSVNIPLIVGGGMRTPEQVGKNAQAGADIIVVGNAFEKDPALIEEIAEAVHSAGRYIRV